MDSLPIPARTDLPMRAAQRATILIVEDSPVQAELLRRVLDEAGYSVLIAQDGSAALAIATEQRPDAVISDINMPVMDGFALCQAIRKNATLSKTPVLLLTMLSDPLDVIRGINAGADAYVTKPYNSPTLISRLESLLADPPASPPFELCSVEVRLGGKIHRVEADATRMLNLLVSTYENAVVQGRELAATQHAFAQLNEHLEQKVSEQSGALQASEQRYRALIEHASDLVFVLDGDGRIAFASPSVMQLGGYKLAEVLGRDITELTHPDDIPVARAAIAALARDPTSPSRAETRYRQKDGGFRVLASTGRNALADPAVKGFVINARDVTAEKRAQEGLRRVNRALKTLSAGSSTVVHAASEAELLQTMCEVIVRSGYAMAWVGFAEPDSAKSIRPVAVANGDPEYIRHADMSWADTARGHGIAGRCIRSGMPQVSRNIESDPSMAPWSALARSHGYQSCAAFPLADASGVFGALSIHAGQAEAFDDDEIALLAEMAGDLAYGIVTLRARETQREADARIEALARFPEENPNPVMRLSARGVVLYANSASKAFLQACGGQLGEVAPGLCCAVSEEAFAANAIREEEMTLDGRVYALTHAPVAEAGYVNVYAVDITARRQAEQNLEAALVALIGTVANTVEMRDPYTAGHQRRVAAIATAIARAPGMGLSADQIQGLYLSATIHDVGKIKVPAEILAKPGQLSALEFELIKVHADAGYEILKDVPFPWPIAEIVRQHHERIDGSGYPRGLKGEQMLTESKILAVADSLEAIVSQRPYRAGRSLDIAMDEIRKGRGSLFDPTAVDACLRLFAETDFVIPP